MRNVLKELGIVGLKTLMFIAGFCACLSMFSGALVVLTTMTVFDSICTSIVPAILFGIWCQHTVKSDLKEEK